MSYAEERIKSLCDNAITNAKNIKDAVDKLATLKFCGQFDYFDNEVLTQATMPLG